MLVIKVGGNEIDDPDFIIRLGQTLHALPEPPVLVHGGGKEIRDLQTRMGVTPQYIDGLRVTDAESLDLVQMVLVGRINKRLVASLSSAGIDAFGMSGVDRACVMVRKMEHPNGDLGFVGQVTRVRAEVFQRLLDDGVLPVLSPICGSPEGSIYNVNADHVAMAVATALAAEQLTFVSNVPGVLQDNQLLPQLTPPQIENLIDTEVITGGMIPKVRSALAAVDAGLAAVRITNLDGLKAGSGTVIVPA